MSSTGSSGSLGSSTNPAYETRMATIEKGLSDAVNTFTGGHNYMNTALNNFVVGTNTKFDNVNSVIDSGFTTINAAIQGNTTTLQGLLTDVANIKKKIGL